TPFLVDAKLVAENGREWQTIVHPGATNPAGCQLRGWIEGSRPSCCQVPDRKCQQTGGVPGTWRCAPCVPAAQVAAAGLGPVFPWSKSGVSDNLCQSPRVTCARSSAISQDGQSAKPVSTRLMVRVSFVVLRTKQVSHCVCLAGRPDPAECIRGRLWPCRLV